MCSIGLPFWNKRSHTPTYSASLYHLSVSFVSLHDLVYGFLPSYPFFCVEKVLDQIPLKEQTLFFHICLRFSILSFRLYSEDKQMIFSKQNLVIVYHTIYT